jgi:hypothetical protein
MTAIIVRFESGNPIFRSVAGVGVSPEAIRKGIELDKAIKKTLHKLSAMYFQKDTKFGVIEYWQLGHLLHELFTKNGLDLTELPLFLENVKLHLPTNIIAKDRSPSRGHLAYCYRLGNLPQSIAMRLKWGEWVTLFDSETIFSEPRFDNWISGLLSRTIEPISRNKIRGFVQSANALLSKIATKDLADEALFRCYEAAWLISNSFEDHNAQAKTIREKIRHQKLQVLELLEGELSPLKFSKILTNELV